MQGIPYMPATPGCFSCDPEVRWYGMFLGSHVKIGCTRVLCSGAMRRMFFFSVSSLDPQPRGFCISPRVTAYVHAHEKTSGSPVPCRSLSIDKAHPECPSGLAIQIQRASATFPLRYVHPFGFESRSCLDIVYGGGW